MIFIYNNKQEKGHTIRFLMLDSEENGRQQNFKKSRYEDEVNMDR